MIDKGILLWQIIYYVVAQYQRTHSDWLFLRHEDIARNPVKHFHAIYKKLDLEFTPCIRSTIGKYSARSNPSKEPALGSFVKRDSKATIGSWKSRLTSREVKRIRVAVEDIASEFYSDAD